MHAAAGGGDTARVRVLQAAGASVAVRGGNNGATPAWVAAEGGHGATLRVLHELGADLTTPMRHGRTRHARNTPACARFW